MTTPRPQLPITRPGVRPVAFPTMPHIADWRCLGNDAKTVELPRPVTGEGKAA